MTTCGVNTLLQATHLIADSLVSAKSVEPSNQLLLSTGLLLDSSEFRYEEGKGTLKIWKLRQNIALAYAGTVNIAEQMLICLDKLVRKKEDSFLEFEKVLKVVATSYTPLTFGQIVQIVGMFIEDEKVIKFVLSCSDSSTFGYESTDERKRFYCIGAGKDLILSHWRKNTTVKNSTPMEDFLVLTANFDTLQILGDDYYIKKFGTGGIMTGVYTDANTIQFHEPRIIIPVPVLKGEILWIANYIKIFEYKGNVITILIRKEKPKLLITIRSNYMSEKITTLPKDVFDLNPRHKTSIWYHYDHRTSNKKNVLIHNDRSDFKAFEWELKNKSWFWGIRTDFFFRESYKDIRAEYGIKDL